MSKVEDLGNYYRIPADNRDLNYDKYFNEGITDMSSIEDYTSHNTRRLNLQEVENLLTSLEFIKGKSSNDLFKGYDGRWNQT